MSEKGYQAFSHFGHTDAETSRSWLSSLAASSVIYIAVGLLVLSIPVTRHIVERKQVQIKFVEKVIKAPPPIPVPAPPPVTPPKIEVKQPAPAAAPKAPAAAAPIIRPGQKVRKLDKPPPPKELAAPKEMPTDAPKEVDAALDKGIAVYGDGKGDVAGLEGGKAGGVAGGRIGADLAIPEDADPPVPSSFNVKPDYPKQAIAANQTGVVTLKVVIQADGTVSDVEVMRGEEPFVSAAIEAVKKWKYQPARYKGQPITVYRVIQIPFKLTA